MIMYISIEFIDTWDGGKAFQCFSGTVILQSRVCDGMVDCLGKFGEDEDPMMCKTSLQTCADYWRAGFKTGDYTLDADSEDGYSREYLQKHNILFTIYLQSVCSAYRLYHVPQQS